jgi:SAM-dependent methyltransferase
VTGGGFHAPGYWDLRASAHLGTATEMAAVCDALQLVRGNSAPIEERGARRVAAHLPGGRVLEVGCGYGRWFDLMGPGRQLIGMDFSTVMGHAAHRRGTAPVLLGDARRLPVAAGALDGAYTMKVLQCLPDADRAAAVAGILRSIRPRGRLVLYEKIAGPGGSPPERWIDWGERAGGRLLRWEGNQFSPLERLLAAIVRSLKPAAGRGAVPARPAPSEPALRDRHPGWYRLYARVHRLAMRLSLPAEPLLERVLPGRWAEHAVFVFEKRAG